MARVPSGRPPSWGRRACSRRRFRVGGAYFPARHHRGLRHHGWRKPCGRRRPPRLGAGAGAGPLVILAPGPLTNLPTLFRGRPDLTSNEAAREITLTGRDFEHTAATGGTEIRAIAQPGAVTGRPGSQNQKGSPGVPSVIP